MAFAQGAGGQGGDTPNGQAPQQIEEDTLVRVSSPFYNYPVPEPEPVVYKTYDKYHGYTQWPVPSKEDAIALVRHYLAEYGASDSLGIAIVQCESGFNANARNNVSSASGLYQFIRSTWEGTAIRMGLPEYQDHKQYSLNAEVNARFGAWLLANSGPQNWECYTAGML